jgi:hypothetical protein
MVAAASGQCPEECRHQAPDALVLRVTAANTRRSPFIRRGIDAARGRRHGSAADHIAARIAFGAVGGSTSLAP